MSQHPVVHGVDIGGLDAYITVHYQVQVGLVIRALAQRDVVRLAVAQIGVHMHVAEFRIFDHRFGMQFPIFAIIQQVYLSEVFDLQQFGEQRKHLFLPTRVI